MPLGPKDRLNTIITIPGHQNLFSNIIPLSAVSILVLPDQHQIKKAMEYLTFFKTAQANQPILKNLLDNTFIARFPTLAVAIFKEVDNKSLGNCRVSSKIWEKFIDEEKFPWVRRIGMHRDNLIGFSEDWRKVLIKAPYEPIKSLAFAVEKFFSSRNKKTWFHFFG